jgi:hypothetical protein
VLEWLGGGKGILQEGECEQVAHVFRGSMSGGMGASAKIGFYV